MSPVDNPPAAGGGGGGHEGGQGERQQQQQQQTNQKKNAGNRHRNNNSNSNNRGRKPNTKSRSPTRPNNNRQQQHQQNSKSKSRSPTRGGNNRNNSKSKSRSPIRGDQQHHNSRRHHHHHHGHHHHNHKHPATMTVISNRCDLWDSAAQFQHENFIVPQNHHHHGNNNHGVPHVNPYWFEPPGSPPTDAVVASSGSSGSGSGSSGSGSGSGSGNGGNQQQRQQQQSVCLARVPYSLEEMNFPRHHNPEDQQQQQFLSHYCDVIDNITPNPHDPNVVHGKYWAQRRRLFSRFDQGIQLDPEGWYSVTPEIIADHVAARVASLIKGSPHLFGGENHPGGATIVDAFCGCGGNSIAFGKIPSDIVSKVVCIDKDRSKLLKAAHNASLYNIPRDKLIFVECNSIFILKYCYRDGEFILDKPTTTMPQYMPPPVMPTTYAGYQIGGLDLLPRNIDVAFFDPPWGGVDYEVLGKNGYDLEKNMKIQVSPPVIDEWAAHSEDEAGGGDEGLSDDFFDTFAQPKQHHMSKNARKKNFNKKTEGEYVNGKDLVVLAAAATRARVVLFDLPRNTSKTSLGLCALEAGYRGNIKLEEHYLNGRLKTVTAYLGSDYSSLINDRKKAGSVDHGADCKSEDTKSDDEGDGTVSEPDQSS